MAYRRNNTAGATATATHATRPARSAGQRSYIVSIDTGSFTNVEIIVGDYHNRAGVWTTSSGAVDTVKVTSNKSRHVYAYVPTSPTTPTTPTKQRTPFTPLQPQSASAARSPSSSSTSTSASVPDAWTKRGTYHYEREDRARDYTTARQQHRSTADERLRARQREREEEVRRQQRQQRRAEAEAEAEARRAARRRQRLAEEQRHEEQKRQQVLLREERKRLERERTRRAREIANAWSSYETRWGLLSQSPSQSQSRQRQLGGASLLTFERIPWPVADSETEIMSRPPSTRRRRRRALDELLRPEAIREFILSPAHSPEVSSKDRIRAALRRWHPDKFARLLGLVVESDKEDVADGVGIVVRCLNEMLERENHA